MICGSPAVPWAPEDALTIRDLLGTCSKWFVVIAPKCSELFGWERQLAVHPRLIARANLVPDTRPAPTLRPGCPHEFLPLREKISWGWRRSTGPSPSSDTTDRRPRGRRAGQSEVLTQTEICQGLERKVWAVGVSRLLARRAHA